MQPNKPSTIVKPTLDTQFHIDYTWWERSEEDLRQYLLTHLPPERRDQFIANESSERVDYIDPETAEVRELDALESAIQEAARQPDFINPQTSLIDSVFRVFLANGNRPCTPRELAEATGRSAETILKTIGSLRVYKGLRPYVHP
ncbi:hypothetical protein CEN41_01705 [Fischerella thermalis CCMEE 5330]|uniref:Uncharacterized protein n=1 Tax=Fischerella thermalis CCMEE 5330 TaxID=2019670 RepID=A0A2N6MNA2_9CYAN|nr:hypothetical protein CEN41_01705 [Fischerella thermalis CCMEE 5330]